MSKKPVQDNSNPFLSIDKSRFAKNPGERNQRGETYIRNKSLGKLAKKAQAEAGSGADEKAGDYFTSLMNMGGVAKMKDSPKVNKSAIAKPASKKEPNEEIPAERAKELNEACNAYSVEEASDFSDFDIEDMAMEAIFAEPQVDLEPVKNLNASSASTRASTRASSQASTQASTRAKQSRQDLGALPEKSRPAQNSQPTSGGTMSAMLSAVTVKEAPKLEQEDISADKTQEEKLLSEYLSSANKESAGQRFAASETKSVSSKKHTPASFTGLADFDPESEEHVFSQAMQQVAPLAGKGREVVPEPERPSGQIFPDNPLQDFLDGKVEFSLEFTDEYLEGHVLGLDPAVIGKMRAGSFSYEAHLDLHGLNAPQAFDALVTFIRASYQRGRRSVLLIPGRGKNSPDGTGILRDKMQEWLTQDPLKRVVLAFCTALPKHGGPGALYVLLRKLKKSRGKIMWDRRPSDPDLFV